MAPGLLLLGTMAASTREEVVRVLEMVEQSARLFSVSDRLEIADAILESASFAKIDVELVLAVIMVESSFLPEQESRAGAIGLMQILPSTGRELARRIDLPWSGRRTLEDPGTNIRLGVFYLAELLDLFDEDRDLAIAAYCYGPGRVLRWLARERPVRPVYGERIAGALLAIDETIERLEEEVLRAQQGVWPPWRDRPRPTAFWTPPLGEMLHPKTSHLLEFPPY